MNMRMEDLVLDAAGVGLGLATVWGTLVLAAGVHEFFRGAAPDALRVVTPEVGRRAVALVCGTAIGALPVAAPAAWGTPGHDRGQTAGSGAAAALAGLPLPERAIGPGPANAPHAPSSVVVRRGDSLWSLTEAHLPPGASEARVDESWRALYAANRDRVGADPDLLLPGTVLRLLAPKRLHHPGAHERAHDSRKERP